MSLSVGSRAHQVHPRSRARWIAALAIFALSVTSATVGLGQATASSSGFPAPAYPSAPGCLAAAGGGRLDEGLAPQQWQQAIGLPVPISGSPLAQRIVLGEVDQYANVQTVNATLSKCGLSPIALTQLPNANGVSAKNGEATLDAYVAGSALPPNAQLLLYRGTNFTSMIIGAGTACGLNMSKLPQVTATASYPPGGCIISLSYGTPENNMPSARLSSASQALTALANFGVIIVAAAGDRGSGGCVTAGLSPVFPASSPSVLAVGGTQWNSQQASLSGAVSTYTPGASLQQTVWRTLTFGAGGDCPTTPLRRVNGAPVTRGNQAASGANAGGGGISATFALPSYQQSAKANYPTLANMRMMPDVSALAGWPGYALLGSGGWFLAHGTSAATPSVAVGIAQVNAALSASGRAKGLTTNGGPLDVHAVVYNSTYASAFTDVINHGGPGTQSSSINPQTDTNSLMNLAGWAALPGYDMASGVGVPNFSALASQLLASLQGKG